MKTLFDEYYLWQSVTGRPLSDFFGHSRRNVPENYKKLLQRCEQGEPLAYILGETEFYGLKIFVDSRVMIPRPETEILVDVTLQAIEQNFCSSHFSVLDVGTGSGCIAIALAKNCSRAQIIASDKSPKALEIAQKNVLYHQLQDQIQLAESDLLNKFFDQKFDLIVANLPYIGTKTNSWVSETVLKYEPHGALFGGENGLELYKKLVQQISSLNYRPKFLIGEIGDTQYEEAKQMLEPYGKVKFFKDYQGFYRVFQLRFTHA